METNLQIRYCLYARKSSEQDERQAMSIDSQIKEMSDLAERENINIVEIKQESHSAKQSLKRPVFNEILKDISDNKYDGILTWAPDRLSRNAGDLGALVDLMDTGKLKRIRTFGQSFSNNPNEKFLLMILCSQAKLENDNRGINVKRGIRASCERGFRPCMPPLGYFTRASSGRGRDVIIDEERAPYIKQIFEMSANNKSGRHIRQWLITNEAKTRTGKTIPLSAIYKILKNTFYYGEFEYPKNSGHWYKGNHAPLITKELFNKVQEALVVPQKAKWGSKDFPFKQFLKCYSCGSSIVGEEKIKILKNGTIKKFTYYHCSRQIKYDCEEPFVREEAIVKELLRISSQLVVDEADCDVGLIRAISKYANMVGHGSETESVNGILSSYIKYVLERGTNFEQTRLVRNLNTKLLLHNRQLLSV